MNARTRRGGHLALAASSGEPQAAPAALHLNRRFGAAIVSLVEAPSPRSRPAAAVPPPTRAPRFPGTRIVRRQVEQILVSPDFDGSRRSKEFLRFIVEEALAGRGEGLTQSAIATAVFGRRDDFDAVVDPIVRIQAGRLRRSLERYYLLAGKHDAVRIALPRGAYLPAFSAWEEGDTAPLEPVPETGAASVVTPAEWPTVVVTVFETGGSAALGEAATRLNEEMVLELGRYRGVRPLLQSDRDGQERPHAGVRFSVDGRLKGENEDLRVTARLVDHATGEQIWGDEFYTTSRPGRWSGPLDDIGRVIAARVGAEEGVIVQLLAAEHRKHTPASVTPYGAMLLSYEFFLTRDPQRLSAAVKALHDVVKMEPDRGAVWTRLARVYYANHAFEVTKVPTPIEHAITYGYHGVRLDPTSRIGRCVLAAALLVKGELASAREELEQALRLSPDSLVYLEIIGSLLTMLGDGTRGTNLIRTARERNPYFLPSATMGLWFDHLRRGEIEQAYHSALAYHDPTVYWGSVMRGSCLGLLGRTAEAAAEVAGVLQTKPDFAKRGRVLMGNIVKLPDVTDAIVDGLARGGLKLA
jgi:adenylate cyclase